MTHDPHGDQPVRTAGEGLESARAAMILVHGRGGAAEDILSLSALLLDSGFAYLAPQARGGSWYPNSFMAPLESNQPHLSSALKKIGSLLEELAQAGIPAERVILLGFSQGACLVTEFAARRPRRYGGVVGLSGGLIGPPGAPRSLTGSLQGTPVLLGCSDVDPFIPLERVKETDRALRELEAAVTLRIYPGLGHSIHPEEIELTRAIMSACLPPGREGS